MMNVKKPDVPTWVYESVPIPKPRAPIPILSLTLVLYVGGILLAAVLVGYALACLEHGTRVHPW